MIMNIVIKNLNKYYGDFKALSNISLEIKPGIFGLLGPNGAGKTTLIRILATLLPCEYEEMRFGDLNWRDGESIREILGYLPQKFSMYKNLSVEDALEHIAVLKGASNIDEEVNRCLYRVNLLKERKKKIKALSGGMLRRFGIAQAIIGNPKLIIVDEPTTGLDPEERIKLRNLLKDLSRDATIIISTHIVEDIEAICQEVAILDKGQILITGTIPELKRTAENKVWKVKLTEDEYRNMPSSLEIIRSTYTDDGYEIRLLSENPIKKGVKDEPTLEDCYLYAIKSKGYKVG